MSYSNTVALVCFLCGLLVGFYPFPVAPHAPQSDAACPSPEAGFAPPAFQQTVPADLLQARLLAIQAASNQEAQGGLTRIATRQSFEDESKAPFDSDRARIVIASPEGPLLVDLSYSFGGKSFRQLREDLIDRRMNEADTNGDGRATWAEALANPRFGDGQLAGHCRERLKSGAWGDPLPFAGGYDANRDGMFDRDEARRLQAAIAPLLSVGKSDRLQGERLKYHDLWFLLDSNRDNIISATEIAQSSARLKWRDGNDNEFVEPFECGEEVPRMRYTCNHDAGYYEDKVFDSSCLVFLSKRPSVELPKEIRYDDLLVGLLNWPPRDYRLSRTTLGQCLLDTLDADGDLYFSGFDLPLFRSGAAHLELELECDEHGESPGALVVRRSMAEVAPHLQRTSPDELTLEFQGLKVLIDAQQNIPSSSDQPERILAQNDTDRNGYLDATELAGNAHYSLEVLDRNADGMACSEEIAEYLRLEMLASRDQAWLAIGDASMPIFSLLDTNHDGRLSLREVQAAPQRLRAFDANNDGRVLFHEIPKIAALTIGRGFVFRRPHASEGEDRDWFSRMDRNRDGDLSPREFLGARETFDKLDRDRDGLLDQHEAMQKPARW